MRKEDCHAGNKKSRPPQNLVQLLGKQPVPDDEHLDVMVKIRQQALNWMNIRPNQELTDFFWSVSLDVYNYGVMQGKRQERKRRKARRSK